MPLIAEGLRRARSVGPGKFAPCWLSHHPFDETGKEKAELVARHTLPVGLGHEIIESVRFIVHLDFLSADRLNFDDVRSYPLHLIAQQRSWSHINQTMCDGTTLGRNDAIERIVALSHCRST